MADTASTNAGSGKPNVTIAVPCYNEEAVLGDSYRRIGQVCMAQGIDYELIFGNDGSDDHTLEMIEGFAAADSRVQVTSHFPNRGAGFTYREMWGAARGDVIIHMDADLAMPPEVALPALLTALKQGADVAVGSRYAGIKADYPLKRRIFSRGYVFINRLLFKLEIVDTQTGFLGFRAGVLDEIDPRADGFEILIEFIAQANEAGFRLVEVGLPWVHDTSSGETRVWSESIKMLVGTLHVRRRFGRYRKERHRVKGPSPGEPPDGGVLKGKV